MALLTLRDIGKIYVSEGNVSVGIRNVNLSFDRGEFVAVTGKSGSGKSTLLNVISGMDSYEEGELLIEGQATSHYLQPDWEEYRQQYISFIFQDYNIIESYTVLQNVELALMHIPDRRERRRRAVELLTRVGMQKHLRQKGSKLSGGQKQRTVIARALAKDSPIILADEPTGNLDSVTSAEIIQLLKEVSEDKLLIVVTHNFEQVEACATRHVRIFDGAVESDHVITAAKKQGNTSAPEKPKQPKPAKKPSLIRNGMTLGRSIFTSRPRLSFFLCILMIIGSLGIFAVTAVSGAMTELFEDPKMFTHIDGRLVLVKQSGTPISDEELESLRQQYGAESALHYDVLLDTAGYSARLPDRSARAWLNYTVNQDFGTKNLIGRYPQASDEVLLRLPIAFEPMYGKDRILIEDIQLEMINFHIVGVQYYYDINQSGNVLFTQEGFELVTASNSLFSRGHSSVMAILHKSGKYPTEDSFGFQISAISRSLEEGKLYIQHNDYNRHLAMRKKEAASQSGATVSTELRMDFTYYAMNFDYNTGGPRRYTMSKVFDDSVIANIAPSDLVFENQSADADFSYTYNGEVYINSPSMAYTDGVIISDELVLSLADELLEKSYRQASLFFENDRAAANAAKELNRLGYVAVLSNTTYAIDPLEGILNTLAAGFSALLWLAAIVFIGFFINLCSTRMIGAFKGDMAIMRSMGIPVKVIRIGMYVRMLLALIPSIILLILGGMFIFRSPSLSKFFSFYLYPWQYGVIILGMLILTLRVTKKQIRKLFGESVKKALKGGAAE